jgi:catalase (peroxidase I)
MNHEPTRADLDQMNERVRQLVAEGFPISEAFTRGFEEMRGSRRVDDTGDSLKVTLLRAPDDEAHSSPGFQQEIRELGSSLKASGVKADARWLTQDSEDAWCGYVGVFVIALPIIVPAVWPAAGSEDTELGVLLEPEVGHGEAEVYTRVQA